MEAQALPLAARMNALLGRPAQAHVPLPETLPESHPPPLPDDRLLAIAAQMSPELAALAHESAGSEAALDLARQAWFPDLNLSAGLTGGLSRMVGAMFMLPTQIEAIRARIEQARAELEALESVRAQYESDLAASFVLNLSLLRDAERQAALFEGMLLPRAIQAVDLAASAYASDRAAFPELLETRRAWLDLRLLAAEIRIQREKALAALETWSAVDADLPQSAGRGAVMKDM